MHQPHDVTLASTGQLSWLNEPTNWRLEGDRLTVTPETGSDFWQGTHYGFREDTGHFLHTRRTDDFLLQTRVHLQPRYQYDQAGLMVRLSADTWIKTSLEYEPTGPSRLGAVVTNHGWSDWSTQDMEVPDDAIGFAITRSGADFVIEAEIAGRWSQLRIARLHDMDDRAPLQCGVYACSPKGAGLRATFHDLSIGTTAAPDMPAAGETP
ncbi:DUF1349 domain-containing protein [Kitasatospora sp. NPDC085879]|uniref:DUF1349 domain-containing protein n=1 Tax=Kitasatospora sp. NPDC085879 TaxID=3154769 RepID=UPI003433E8BD